MPHVTNSASTCNSPANAPSGSATSKEMEPVVAKSFSSIELPSVLFAEREPLNGRFVEHRPQAALLRRPLGLFPVRGRSRCAKNDRFVRRARRWQGRWT